MFSEETDWLTRFRRAGLEGAVLPGRRGRPRRRRLARRPAVRREPARPPALPRQAPGPEGGRARAPLLLWSLRLRALLLRREDYRAGVRFLASGDGAHSRSNDRVPAARVRHGLVLLPGIAVARALRTRSVVGGVRLGARLRLRRLGGRVHAAPLDPSRGRRAGGDHGRRAHRRPRADVAEPVAQRARSGSSGSCSACSSGTSRARSSATGSSTRRACASSSTSASLHLRTVDEFKDGGLHPGYAFPLWHGFLALVARFSGLDPEQVVRHEPSLLVPLACVLVVGGRRRRLPLALARPRGARGPARALLLRAGPRRLVRRARAAGDRRRASCRAGRDRALLRRATRGAATRRVAAIVRRARAMHPTYASSCSCRSLARRVLAVARLARARRVPVGLVAPLAAAARRRDALAQPERRRAGARRSRTTAAARRLERPHHFRLAAEVLGRTGAVAVAALVLVPVIGARAPPALGGVRARRHADRARADARAGALRALLGRGLALAVAPAPASSRSRSPSPAALRCSRAAAGVLPLALVAGIVLERRWPGDFAYGLRPRRARRSRRGSRSSAARSRSSSASRSARTGRRSDYALGGARRALLVRAAGRRPRLLALDARIRSRSASRSRRGSSTACARRCRRARSCSRRSGRATEIAATRRSTSSPRRSPHVANTKANDPTARARAVAPLAR